MTKKIKTKNHYKNHTSVSQIPIKGILQNASTLPNCQGHQKEEDKHHNQETPKET